MKFAARKPIEATLNLTALIDVMLVLLIFFMVTTTFERQKGLKVKLPEANPATMRAEPQRLELVISRDGRFYLGPNEVVNPEADTLKSALARAANNDFAQSLTIRADARAQHRYVVRAMDAAGQLGFANLTIATTESK
jgi:biopolymer transport protein ExbD